MNRRIRVPEVRVIDNAGAQLGIMPTFEALQKAQDLGFDLVEVSPRAAPPVCRIMDFGKYKYLQKKKASETRQVHRPLKEVKLRYMTDEHDIATKVGHVRTFLQEKSKVRISMAFQGRAIVHKQLGIDKIRGIIDAVATHGAPEGIIQSEGKTVFVILAPKE